MDIPSFYDPNAVGTHYTARTNTVIDTGHALGLQPADQDTTRIALLLVDMQVDFVHEDGALSVPGAVDDTRRIIEWMYKHVDQLTTIIASLDSHIPLQIFSPAWWIDTNGKHPQPYTVITAESVHAGDWSPLYETAWSKQYVVQLEEQAKKQLMIWPYHTLIGTNGHTLTPALYEAIAYHTGARQAQPIFITKGTIAKTENYSIFEPEVKDDTQPNGGLDVAKLDLLATYDEVYIAGQAKSHCVLETVTSLMRYYANQPDVISKFRVLMDGMSSVAHPEIDFEAIANEALQQYAEQGLTLTTTSEALK